MPVHTVYIALLTRSEWLLRARLLLAYAKLTLILSSTERARGGSEDAARHWLSQSRCEGFREPELQTCFDRAFESSHENGVWLAEHNHDTLSLTQHTAYSSIINAILSNLSAHKRREGTCTCGSIALLPIQPRYLRCLSLAEQATADALVGDIEAAMQRVNYIVACFVTCQRREYLEHILLHTFPAGQLQARSTWAAPMKASDNSRRGYGAYWKST